MLFSLQWHLEQEFFLNGLQLHASKEELPSVRTKLQQRKAAGESLSVITTLCLFTEASVRGEVCIHGNRLGREAASQSDPERCESDAIPPWRPAGGSDEGWCDVATSRSHWHRNKLWLPPAPQLLLFSGEYLCILVMLAHLLLGIIYGYYPCLWSPRATLIIEQKGQLSEKVWFQYICKFFGPHMHVKMHIRKCIYHFLRACMWVVLTWDRSSHSGYPAYLSMLK